MWTYANPVKIQFGPGSFAKLPSAIGRRRYAVVTYPVEAFAHLVAGLAESAGDPLLLIDDVAPNPDYALLHRICHHGCFATSR